MSGKNKTIKDPFEVATHVINQAGPHIRLAIPLGLGKPNPFVNALYALVKESSNLKLDIYTALTLTKPSGKSLLEKNFLGPFADRLFQNYPNLTYDLEYDQLPENINVYEFYFAAGKKVNHRTAQENYISTNYTHVARDLIDLKINVIAQIVAESTEFPDHYSMSCNPDVSLDLVEAGKTHKMPAPIVIGQIHPDLPFMRGDAVVRKDTFDFVLDPEVSNYPLFGPPKMSVSPADYMIGLYASTLVKDDGELQIGIGSLGDSLVYNLMLRHQNNKKYNEIIENLGANKKFGSIINKKGELGTFDIGLLAATEMFVDSFTHLIDAGILKKKVYDHPVLQRLINENLITETVTEKTLYYLLERHAVSPKLTQKDFSFLVKFGIFKDNCKYENGYLVFEDQTRIEANLNKDENFQQIINKSLGDKLKNGAFVHGGFFLGPPEFYKWLNSQPPVVMNSIHMKSVTKINQLYGHEQIDRLHRKNARFVNTCLKMTLSGSAVSDGLENGQVISGVGGQFNFVSMAQELPDGHSILQLRSTRLEKGQVKSNIVFNYGHITIPRHMRDIVITEYGIADIRGLSDSDMAARLIEIADSRFQQSLIEEAKSYGKLKQNFSLKSEFKNNYPKSVSDFISKEQQNDLFPAFPFGTSFTEEELKIGKVLKQLKALSQQKPKLIKAMLLSLIKPTKQQNAAYLKRMKLDQPKNLKERLYSKLLNNFL